MANGDTYIRAFISYSTKEKEYGAQVKRVLENFGIECFLAHEDLEVSEEWKERIFEELLRCDLFITLLSKAFKDSDWAPQEGGVIVGRKDVAIIPLSIDGTMPFGFISHLQGKRIPIEGVTEPLIIPTLTKKIPRKIIPIMISKVAAASSFRSAEAAMKPLVPLFNVLDDQELDVLVGACIHNYEVWDASLCQGEYIPELIRINKSRIDQDKLKALEYQIESREWFPSEA